MSTHRWSAAAKTSTAVAGLALACVLVLTACAPGSTNAGGGETPSTPLPSPSGTWVTPDPDETEGPTTPAPLPTQSADIDEPIELTTGIEVSLVGVASTSVTAETPGEVDGPAVAVQLTVVNGSKEPINLDSAVVNLWADDGEYGVGTTAGSPSPLKGTVEPGKSAKGKYVFMLDPAKGRDVTVSVNYAAGEPVAIFTGKTS
jgi:hypothetical protein